MHRQIRRQIAQTIREGDVPKGTRLPSTRLLAKLLGVSRNTVFTAYEELAADDLIRGEQGAGMRVNNGSTAPEVSWVTVKRVIDAARYPAKVLALEDPDGNPLYVRF